MQGSLAESLKVRVMADWKVLLSALFCGVLLDLLSQTGIDRLAGSLFFLLVPIALVLSGRLKSRASLVAAALVPLFGVWLTIRQSPALLVPDVLCILFLLGASGMWSRAGSVFRTTLLELFDRAIALLAHFFSAIGFLWPALPRIHNDRLRTVAPILRGLAIAVPIVAVLAALLASADSVFASFFDFHVDLGSLPQHLFFILAGAWLAGTVLRAASSEYEFVAQEPSKKLGFTEATVVLGIVVLLYFVFVGTQIVVWAGGAKHVLETAGLTYSEHARQGFFQLIAVAVITLALLTGFRNRVARNSHSQERTWQVLSLVAVALTLAIVGVAVQRLHLYELAYGFTMLRLYATVMSLWIGIVFILFGTTVLMDRGAAKWLLSASVMSALAFALVLNVLNPEKVVVVNNLRHVNSSTVPLDMQYLEFLSNDGLATVIDHFGELNAEQQKDFVEELCYRRSGTSSNEGLNYNSTRQKVNDFVKKSCPARQ